MRRLFPLVALLVMTLATSAHAVPPVFPGCNLRWDHCYGDGGVLNRNATCDTNTGTETLVASFDLPSLLPGVSGIEVVIDLASAGASLPAWWQFKNVGSCRLSSLVASSIPVDAPVTFCPDWAEGHELGGLAAYQLGHHGPTTARILTAWAVPQNALATLNALQEYFAQTLRIDYQKTVGTGACAGCLTPVCIVFSSVNVVPGINPGVKLTGPANGTDSNFATWQGGAGVGSALGAGCPAATPTRKSTWGEVKALYH